MRCRSWRNLWQWEMNHMLIRNIDVRRIHSTWHSTWHNTHRHTRTPQLLAGMPQAWRSTTAALEETHAASWSPLTRAHPHPRLFRHLHPLGRPPLP